MTTLAAAKLIVLDGGTGRELLRIGAPFKQPEWSALALIEAPEYVTRVHQSYVDAGADVITTNTYALVPFHIGEERFAARGAEWAALAGSLARAVADAAPRPVAVAVAGSLPPVCGSYRPDLVDIDRARPILAVLVAALTPYIDHWQAETLSSLSEARLVGELTAPTGKPLWLSFTIEDSGSEPKLRSGESVADAARLAQALGASAILFNCSQPEAMAEAVRVARATCDLAIGVYANAFPPQSEDTEANSTLHDIRADLDPAGYAKFASAWRDAGATILGGCCGIGPEHIAALAVVTNKLI